MVDVIAGEQFLDRVLHALYSRDAEAISSLATEISKEQARVRGILLRRGSAPDNISVAFGSLRMMAELSGVAASRASKHVVIEEVRRTSGALVALHVIGLADPSEGIVQGDVALRLERDSANFSRLTARLEDLGLVRKDRSGRKKILSLTPLGFEVLERIRPGWRSLDAETGEPLKDRAAVGDAARSTSFFRASPSPGAHSLIWHSTSTSELNDPGEAMVWGLDTTELKRIVDSSEFHMRSTQLGRIEVHKKPDRHQEPMRNRVARTPRAGPHYVNESSKVGNC